MGNRAGDDVPVFRKGQALSAADLNKIVALIIKRVIGAEPIKITSIAGGISISLSESGGRGPQSSKVQVCRITANLGLIAGDAMYTVQEYTSSKATATTVGNPFNVKNSNNSTGILGNQWVHVIKSKDGSPEFFYPLGSC